MTININNIAWTGCFSARWLKKQINKNETTRRLPNDPQWLNVPCDCSMQFEYVMVFVWQTLKRLLVMKGHIEVSLVCRCQHNWHPEQLERCDMLKWPQTEPGLCLTDDNDSKWRLWLCKNGNQSTARGSCLFVYLYFEWYHSCRRFEK